jgi:hypothetical protein
MLRAPWAVVLSPLLLAFFIQAVAAANGFPPRYTLQAESVWQLNLPAGERFDASGLLLRSNGDLLTVNDRGPSLYRIEFLPQTHAANLILVPDCFTPRQLAPWAAEKFGRYDSEGIAEDAQGRLYLCEEANRWILRCDPRTKTVERLDIDWSSVKRYFSPSDRNASFEGVAVGDGKLFVANERAAGRIIVVNLADLKILDHFAVRPAGSLLPDMHYSDLSWFEGALYVLLREQHTILRVDPATKKVQAEFNFKKMEHEPEHIYETRFPGIGVMEGLAVDKKYFWLCTDNNGLPRKKFPNDTRPSLFKCRRPDAEGSEK